MRMAEVAALVENASDLIEGVIAPQSSLAAPTTDPQAAMLKGAYVNLQRALRLMEAADA